MFDKVAAAITQATGETFRPETISAIHGGDINHAYHLRDNKRNFFVKTNQVSRLDMFEAEAAGLSDILSTQTLRTPRPICVGQTGEMAFLVLEHLTLSSTGNDAEMGRQLAYLHRCSAAQFGWRRNNTIGSTPQINTWTGNWLDFLREQRLAYQLRLAKQNGLDAQLQNLGEILLDSLPAFFSEYTPTPALLHGDLWRGNAGFISSGEPVIFDPATYYGDREADLAMTELFGGFGQDFYAAYQDVWPLDPGYATRKTLYNLYHILNHANLFGGGYTNQAIRMLERLLAASK